MRWQVQATTVKAARAQVEIEAGEKGCAECGSRAVVAFIEPALTGGVKASAWCSECAGGGQ